MTQLLIKLALVQLALFLTAELGHAQVILFNNGSTSSSVLGFYGADASSGTSTGDVFTPTLSGTGNVLTFAGGYTSGPPTDAFTVELFSTNAGAPSALLATSTLTNVTRVSLGFSEFGAFPAYQFTGTLSSPFTLSNASTYWLGITDADTPADNFSLLKSTTGTATNMYTYTTPEDTFSAVSPSTPIAFSISSVPEPSTWVMMIGGLGGLALFRLRRKAKI